ncbi:MAG: flippase-like domain-containing protein [Myxococcales bacterium]|nr:flippase-like domain-containing protein [Myxococcales bacterium]
MSGDPTTPPSSRKGASKAALLFGIVSSVAFLGLAIRGVDWDSLTDSIRHVNWLWLVAYVGIFGVVQTIRIVRWGVLLGSLGETNRRRIASVGAVGLTAIFFLPARLGELVRPVAISRGNKVGFGEAMATVIVERLIDGIMVGLMVFGIGFIVDAGVESTATIRSSGLIVGGIFLALTVGVFIAARFSAFSISVIERLFGRWPKLVDVFSGLVRKFQKGLFTLLEGHVTLKYLTLSLLMWFVNGMSIVALLQAFHLDLPVTAAFVILGAQSIGILVPAAPTSVGTFHAAVAWSVGLFGIGQGVAFAFAALFHAAQIVANLSVGLVGLAIGGMKRSELRLGAIESEQTLSHPEEA